MPKEATFSYVAEGTGTLSWSWNAELYVNNPVIFYRYYEILPPLFFFFLNDFLGIRFYLKMSVNDKGKNLRFMLKKRNE